MSRELFDDSANVRVEASLGQAQTGAWPGSDIDGDWPLFLTRREPPLGAESPPPLPATRTAWLKLSPKPRSVRAALSAGLTVTAMAGASALMLSDGQRRFEPPSPPRALATPLDTANPSLPEHRGLAGNERFAFAGGLPADRAPVAAIQQEVAVEQQEHLAVPLEPVELETGHELALAPTADPRNADDTSDPVSVMILRNLPDTAAFLAGVESADGSWVIAASEFDHVVVTALTPNAEPVSADAELISRAGLSLGVVRLPVRPSSPFMTAAAAPESEPAAEPGSQQQQQDAPVSDVSAAASAAAAETQKPAAPKVRVHVRKSVAIVDPAQKPKRRAIETVKAPAKPDNRAAGKANPAGQERNGAADAEVASADAKPKGVLAKFVDWFTGKNKSATEDDNAESAASAFSLTPKD